METTQTLNKYSKGSRIIHWLVALIVISLLSMGFFLGDLPGSLKPVAYMLHKSFGITVLFLTILRIIWIVHTGKPRLPASVPLWQRFISRAVHHSLYILLLIMPLAGWVMSMAAGRTPIFFDLFSFPLPGIEVDKQLSKSMFNIHSTVAWILIVLLFFHIGAAIKHHFIDKDDVLKRML